MKDSEGWFKIYILHAIIHACNNFMFFIFHIIFINISFNISGEPLFRLMRITPPVTNPLQRASIVDVDPKFQVFSVNPEYSEPLSTIWRKGGGSKNEIKKYSQNQKGGFNIVMNFDDSLDLEAKCRCNLYKINK